MGIPERKFTVRHDKNSKNSFVRLHPATAQALWKDALRDVVDNNNNSGTPRRRRYTDTTARSSSSLSWWRVTEEQRLSAHVTSGIEFLPLKIRNTSDDTVVYASYNGGDTDDENVWLPDHILSEASDVWIRAVPQVKAAKEVTVEALSAEDWTRIQHYSEWLEDGGFLRQVSLVYAGQEIRVHLPDDSVVWVRTLRVDKEADDASTMILWPEDADDDHHHQSNETLCRRILADTELVLLPATVEGGNNTPETIFRLQTAFQDYSLSMQKLYTRLGQVPELVSCSNGTVVLHPESWCVESPYCNISIVGESSEGFLKSYNVRVEVSEHVKKDCIGKSLYKTKSKLQTYPFTDEQTPC
eukprot:scaffold9936_cov156-Amphora_coffeaeformis.AAC.3